MQLSERKQQQVDAIASLVTQPNRSAIGQGVELAVALGDQDVFAGLLEGLVPRGFSKKRVPKFRRFPTPDRATRFDSGAGNQAWLDLAMLHLLAASELPVKSKVSSIALGILNRKFSNPAPKLWIEGLERLDALTHLDLHLTSADRGLDLGGLAQFPQLSHLRIRGPVLPGPIPSIKNLQELNGVQLQFEPGAEFPELRSLRGRLYHVEHLRPETMPKLVDIQVRDGVSLVGFESLDKLWCFGGNVEALGCRRVEQLRVNAASFNAPDLRHVGLLDGLDGGIDVSQLETLGQVRLSRTNKFNGDRFPEGTQLAAPKVILNGPKLTDLGNLGELPGMEHLSMTRVQSPISLETLRYATDLRVLDIGNSPGITDLTPLAELPKLEVLVISDPDRFEIPGALVDCVQKSWRPNRQAGSTGSAATKKS